jgi:ketosteroid isomerase-like protein
MAPRRGSSAIAWPLPGIRRHGMSDSDEMIAASQKPDSRWIGIMTQTSIRGDGEPHREKAGRPEDLARMFLERANAGDVSAVVGLYEPGAVLAFPPGEVTVGSEAIREVYKQFLASRPVLTSEGQSPPLVNGDIALTSTRLPGGGATVEIARRQPDGTWLWAIDQPRIAAPA